MEHTKGKLEAIGSSKSKFKDAYFIRLKNKKDSFIAKTYGHTGFPAEANAKELVRRWNAFEDGGLVDELGLMIQAFFEWHANHFEDFDAEINGELLELANMAEAALAKS